MEAVIDPSGPTIVGCIPPNASRHGGPWADFVTVPIPYGLENKPLRVNLVDDAYVLSLDDVTISAEAWNALRSERNARLSACDWTRLDDVQCDKEAWSQYRQDLRNLPKTVTDPTNVTWPVPPV